MTSTTKLNVLAAVIGHLSVCGEPLGSKRAVAVRHIHQIIDEWPELEHLRLSHTGETKDRVAPAVSQPGAHHGFVATVNTPGYLPDDEHVHTFETAQEAWSYLAEEREDDEDGVEADRSTYSDCREVLAVLGAAAHWRPNSVGGTGVTEYLRTFGLDANGCGTIVGRTPGYTGSHDLGRAYTVTKVGA